jgi:TolB-like protein
MKKALIIGLLALCALAGLIAGCSSTGGGSGGSSVSSTTARPYSGAGGKGMSVAILTPEGKGLSAEQNYLPTLVQGVFVSDFARYSAISVLDRQALEKTLRETESGIYEEGADFVELGKITKTGYILSGSVTRTSSGYSFAVTVADTKTGAAKAAYSGACSVQEFDDFSGIKKASLELLTQMGVSLTGAAKAELSGAGSDRQVKSQTALAQGITAQKTGNTAASLAYYYTANQYDSTLKEAAARANQMSASVRTGSLGENIRNELAWRNEWLKLRAEAEAYLQKNTDALVEFRYSSKLKQESVDYSTGKVTFSVDTEWLPIELPPTLKMLNDLDKGLKATKRAKAWGMDGNYFVRSLRDYFNRDYHILIALYNDKGKELGLWKSVREWDGNLGGQRYAWAGINYTGKIVIVNIPVLFTKTLKYKVKFGVNAYDITDNMTIKIINVEERPREAETGSKRNGTDIIPISTY